MTTQVNPFMFRAYDIRGIVGDDLTEDVTGIIGLGLGTYMQEHGSKRIIVGQDNRPSSDQLKARLIESLLSTGCDVIDIGLCTTPMMYAAVIAWQMDGGVSVTASHNPPQFNGFKLVGKDAYPIGGDEILDLLKVVQTGDFLHGKGKHEQKGFLDEYVAKILRTVKIDRPLKVVVDTGNAVAGIAAPRTLKGLGCDVIELFAELDGRFPNHSPDPEEEKNLRDLEKKVAQTGADLGFGIDGDGDRLGLVDEHGQFREADYILMLLAQDFLGRHPGSKILLDVKTSQNTIDYIRRAGGKPFMWKTGHSLIKMKMRQDGVLFGGELSGHMFMFEDYYPIDDAIMAASRLVSFLSRSSKPVSEYFKDLPKLYSTRLIEVPCPDEVKFEVVEKVKEDLLKKYTGFTEDGIRADMPGGWALVRASNTGAKLSMRFEANTPQRLEEIESEVRGVIRKYTAI